MSIGLSRDNTYVFYHKLTCDIYNDILTNMYKKKIVFSANWSKYNVYVKLNGLIFKLPDLPSGYNTDDNDIYAALMFSIHFLDMCKTKNKFTRQEDIEKFMNSALFNKPVFELYKNKLEEYKEEILKVMKGGT